MGQIENTISVYERLSKRKYKITVENGLHFVLVFDPKHYHHLVGLHYLRDIMDIAEPAYDKRRFYRQLKNKRISEDKITKSALFKNIAERIKFFEYIEEIVSASECKIIVEFDKNKAGSDIEARFILYKREGNSLKGEPVTYYLLFIGYDDSEKTYFPATYVVEHSKKYVTEQEFLDCKIELLDND